MPGHPPPSSCRFPPPLAAGNPGSPRPGRDPGDFTVPFDSTEEAWFWFVQAQDARSSGARIVAGRGMVPRPCEPLDMLRVVDRLYRQRKLIRDHLHVLVHYGRRLMAPDPERRLEVRASGLWREALAFLDPVLREKGIVADARLAG
ncbi:hypothetical protein [Skermanella pratensis]|uniref:hypothetical protein n=1 Tax=Skermanella pratensis TaxID=2233999 RepID=UPI001FEA0C58|nr:hypothetical protein [Skermanella pratensis]